jgi:hypothetical protein
MAFFSCIPLLFGIATLLTTSSAWNDTSAWNVISLATPRFECSGKVATIETHFMSDMPLLRLSVDWGEDPAWYNYDTAYANISSNKVDDGNGKYYYATNGDMEIQTNLPEWNGETTDMKSGYSVNSSIIRIHHVYEEAGTFMPVFLVVGYLDSFSKWKTATYSCPYQISSIELVDSGSRGDCETEGHTLFRIDKAGGCTMSSTGTFPRKERRSISKNTLYVSLMGIGGFVMYSALRAAWCQNRKISP